MLGVRKVVDGPRIPGQKRPADTVKAAPEAPDGTLRAFAERLVISPLTSACQ